jgi:hypothetical protein
VLAKAAVEIAKLENEI